LIIQIYHHINPHYNLIIFTLVILSILVFYLWLFLPSLIRSCHWQSAVTVAAANTFAVANIIAIADKELSLTKRRFYIILRFIKSKPAPALARVAHRTPYTAYRTPRTVRRAPLATHRSPQPLPQPPAATAPATSRRNRSPQPLPQPPAATTPATTRRNRSQNTVTQNTACKTPRQNRPTLLLSRPVPEAILIQIRLDTLGSVELLLGGAHTEPTEL
jgi:hypothetical protein